MQLRLGVKLGWLCAQCSFWLGYVTQPWVQVWGRWAACPEALWSPDGSVPLSSAQRCTPSSLPETGPRIACSSPARRAPAHTAGRSGGASERGERAGPGRQPLLGSCSGRPGSRTDAAGGHSRRAGPAAPGPPERGSVEERSPAPAAARLEPGLSSSPRLNTPSRQPRAPAAGTAPGAALSTRVRAGRQGNRAPPHPAAP